ncbi:cyclase family protein [Actinoplanes sp. NPDC026619]|uniref:cyclase family protein n=1 Tax=Actinoplanes sp. NPDC026619 TaxID=3155798 RepID=UPI0033F85455
MTAADLPSYDELRGRTDAPAGSSWGLWGARDVLGTLNLLGPAGVAAGLAEARTGRTFSLNLDLGLPTPELIGRTPPRHSYAPIGPYGADDVIDGYNTQLSSQWDGFGHVRHPVYGHYNGLERAEHGVDHWARRGISGRGVLADVARFRQAQGRPLRLDHGETIEADELRATLAAQGTDVATGDILLVRTGWAGWYRGLDPGQRAAVDASPCVSPGLAQGEATCRYLWDLHIAAAAADNTSFEMAPFEQVDGADPAVLATPDGIARFNLMYNLLSLLGLPFGELFDLDDLAADCARQGRWSFLFVSAPLRLRGAIGSPANAIAIT